MNKILLFATVLVAGAMTLVSCDDDLSQNPTVVTPTSFTLNQPTVQNGLVDLALTDSIALDWTQPQFTDQNSPVAATYTVQVSTAGTFTKEYDASLEDNTGADYATLDQIYTTCSVDLDAEDLDLAMMQLNNWAQDAVPAKQELSIRVVADLSNASGTSVSGITSNVVKLNTIPYYQALTNADPELWYLIGSDIGDGLWGTAVPSSSLPMQPVDGAEFDAKTGQGMTTWTGYLAGNGFKLKKTATSWDDQWGSGDDGYVHNDGGSGNITVSEPGIYTVTLNTADSKFASSALTITKYDGEVTNLSALYLTGSFNSWGKDNPMSPVHTYSGAQNHDWYTTVTLTAGAEVKFYDGSDSWTYNSGGTYNTLNTGGYGYGAHGGSNIVIPEGGTYLVIYNDITRYYRFILQ